MPELTFVWVLALLRQRQCRRSEARIQQPYNIRVVHKPITTLRRLLTNFKDKDKPEGREEVVYKIKCCDCLVNFIGETCRNHSSWPLITSERQEKVTSTIILLNTGHLQKKHQIDWDSATYITYSTYYYQRITLKKWFTNLQQTPLNPSQQLPAPYKYKRLIDGLKQN